MTTDPRVRSGRSDAEDAPLSPGDFSLEVTAAAVVDGRTLDSSTGLLMLVRAMDGSDPRWRRLVELEGLTECIPGRKEGYELVTRAVE